MLDDVGRELIQLLPGDGRLTNGEPAEKVAFSRSACRRRVRRLAHFQDKCVRVAVKKHA